MEVLRDFEQTAIELLTRDVLSPEVLAEFKRSAEFVSCKHTGYGYFLTLRHPKLPEKRVVCHRPTLIGVSEGIETGFVIFLENHELTLECHSWGDETVPDNYRERHVEVTAT